MKSSRKKTWVWVVTLGLLIVGLFLWLYPFPSSKKVDFSPSANPLFYEGDRSEQFNGMTKKDRLYVPVDYIQHVVDPHIVYDEQSQSLIITRAQNVYQIPQSEAFYRKNDRKRYSPFPPLIKEEGQQWLAADFLQDIYALSVKTYPNGAVHILPHGFEKKTAAVKTDLKEYMYDLRSQPTVTSSYYTSLQALDKVQVLQEDSGFYLIVMSKGYTGYIPQDALTIRGEVTVETRIPPEETVKVTELTRPIHLAWDGIYTADANPEEVKKYSGVDVLSPTWFTLSNQNGDIHSLAADSYVQSAHANGDKVWALFSNDFDPELTSKVLPSYKKRSHMIQQLLQYAKQYKLDGINLDFENVYEEDGKWFTQFVRELAPLAHKQGLVVSVDITFISSSGQWSGFYERAELSEAADFIAVMAYDEHWATSSQAGSVASLPWVESNLQALLKEVPSEQLLLGIPLYTRLWEEKNGKVSSTSMTMDEAEQWVKDNGLTPELDESSGQHFIRTTKDGTTYKMWLENETSLKKRIKLIRKYDLAGIATWSVYFANEDTWNFIDEQLKLSE
ncbi:glycosyl hydrolase family 18 protein [Halobacillus shinanisalinarum]|uniref:Glycosyl hydrolase family 18 protein n=1 Tax=Halobacillus shinanisalinarum TaxID=2932258 RepID=A0ABY4GZX3_9BACI|nr:glycosyl hydrolase family 18 protein [Halobacillus shinanisalinarum]UOQ93449.1 glycosyl hydrolase family 18 protein [Halobacillus shinanisalinarum]